MGGRIKAVLVHAEHDGDVLSGRRRGDDHLPGSGGEVLPRVVGLGEPAGGLEHDVDAERPPRERGRILLLQHRDAMSVDRDRLRIVRDHAVVRPVHGIIPEEVRERLGVGEVVDRRNLERGAPLHRCADHLPPNPTEPVNADANRHDRLCSEVKIRGRQARAPARM